MTDTTVNTPKMPLGAGQIVGETFSIFFKRFPAIFLLAFVPALFEFGFSYVLSDGVLTQVDAGNEINTVGIFVGTLVAILLSLVIISVVTAAIVQLSYDAKLDRPVRIGQYVGVAIRNLPAIILLSIAVAILYSFGFMLFIVPGLWLYAVFSVFVPSIVIENQGFGAMRRSAELTKGYRWPIVGTLFIVFVCVILIVTVGSTVAGFVSNTFILTLVLQSLGSAIGYGLVSVTVALIFARLKEIKEGVTVSDLVEVFK